jgi:hypothetical protein
MTLAASAAQTVDPGQYHTLQVTVTGNQITGSVDGTVKINWTNRS